MNTLTALPSQTIQRHTSADAPLLNVDAQAAHQAQLNLIRDYYRVTADDYRQWSSGMNMHFGLQSAQAGLWNREGMLEALNDAVIDRLGIANQDSARVADLGCGCGATARRLVARHAHAVVDAVTIAPEQVSRGSALAAQLAGGERIHFHLADYLATGLPSASYEATYAIESACHAQGPDKAALIAEMARITRPGGQVVIADAMLRNGPPTAGPLAWIYRLWCIGSLSGFGRGRAGASRGASQGVGEAVWLTHTMSRQRRMAPRMEPALRVGPARGRWRRCKCAPGPQPRLCFAPCHHPLADPTRSPPKARQAPGWAVPEMAQLPALTARLQASGFENVQVQDISLSVAASAAHVPWVASRYLVRELIAGKGHVPLWRVRHALASFASLALGLALWRFGYFIITATKKEHA
jgi:SAM-dependent methyltransferase